MDGWKTPDGRKLVAWRPETATRLPDGTERPSFSFLLLSPERIESTWEWRQDSVEDWLYTSAYFVEAGALQCCFSGDRFAGGESCSVSVVLSGLEPLPQAEVPPRDQIEALVRARARALALQAAERHEADERRRRSLHAALRDVPGTGPIVLTFALDGAGWVVRHGDETWWRATDWPWLGTGLRDQLGPVVKARYAPRPARLEVDDATWRSLDYSND
ncbi:MAG: hypothetical protein JNJ54_06125 [Myxococcaceae bacterium]|nr:hypothetical protein [Myxococcaceae bacterium]